MADPVYLSITELPGTGAAAPTVVDFNFAGGYINRAHIKAYILNPTTFARTDVTVLPEHFVTDWRLQLPVSVPVGSVLRVYRDTPKDAPLVDFTNGARINEGNLDLVAQQATFVAAEAIDQLEGSGVREGLAAASAAAASADAAAASEAAAAASAAAAFSSQTSAAASASSASTSAGAAAASQSAAAASAAAASSDAAAADSDAAAAAASASAAAASQSAAAGSASSAASSAATATSAASTATSQASAAASSATAAAGSAAAAAASAAAADASADAAAASAASVNDANLVHKTGDETIAGTKTFSSPIVGTTTGNLSGLKNLVINGTFSVNQRGYTSGTATTGANQYTLDRWRIVTSGQAATFTTTGAGRTVTAPSGGIEQVIEGASIGGGTYVINWTGTASCTVNGVSRTKGATFTLTANTNATVRFSSGTVTDVQIEPGEVATAFELRPVAVELMLCQRYFEAGSGYGWGYAGSAGIHRCAYTPWKVTKRASPSVATSNVAYTNASGILAEFIDASKSGYFLTAASAGFFAVSFDWTASAEL